MERFFTFFFISILSVFILTGSALSVLVGEPGFVLVEINENEENNSESESESNINNAEYPNHAANIKKIQPTYFASTNLSFIYLNNHSPKNYTKVFTPPPQLT